MLRKIASKLLRLIIGNKIKPDTNDLNQLLEIAIAKLIAPMIAETENEIAFIRKQCNKK